MEDLVVAEAPPLFEQFFEETKSSMLRLASLLSPTLGVAEEIVQDAYIKVYSRWARIDSPIAYMRQCVINGSHSALRRTRRERRHLAEALPASVAAEPLPELVDVLAQLAPRRRQVVVLRFYLQMTVPEIARALGMSEGTVKSTQHDAIQQLKGLIDERGS